MATNDVPVTGGVQAIAQLLQVLGGTKSTSNTQLDTSALQGVLKQLQGQDYSQVLQQIFQQASTQIPRLQAAYGNATGGRSGNNSAAAAALEKLLASVTTNATSELAKLQLQNSGQQAQVAQALAQGSQRQTQQQGTNLPQAAKVVAALKTASSLYPLLKKGAGALGILGDGASAEGLGFTPNASFGELPAGTGGFGSLNLGGSSMPSGGFDLGNLDFGGSGSFGGFDGVDFGSLFNAGMDPFAGISFGDGGFDFGSFGNDMSIGIPSDSFSLGSEGAGLSLPSDVSGYLPFLNAASYLVEPGKLSDAFELGQGNVLGDAGQIASLGATVGGLGGALGASMGGLAAIAPALGPIGAGLSIAAAIAGGATKEDKQKLNSYQYLAGDKKNASNLEKARYFSQPFSTGDIDHPYINYSGDAVSSLAQSLNSTKNKDLNFSNFLGEESTAEDRAYAYFQDTLRKGGAGNSPLGQMYTDWIAGVVSRNLDQWQTGFTPELRDNLANYGRTPSV